VPVDKAIQKLNDIMDEFLSARADKQARKDAKRARRDEGDDPKQFPEDIRQLPIAEPHVTPQEDSLSKRVIYSNKEKHHI
jgi:hypothetical protein